MKCLSVELRMHFSIFWWVSIGCNAEASWGGIRNGNIYAFIYVVLLYSSSQNKILTDNYCLTEQIRLKQNFVKVNILVHQLSRNKKELQQILRQCLQTSLSVPEQPFALFKVLLHFGDGKKLKILSYLHSLCTSGSILIFGWFI